MAQNLTDPIHYTLTCMSQTDHRRVLWFHCFVLNGGRNSRTKLIAQKALNEA